MGLFTFGCVYIRYYRVEDRGWTKKTPVSKIPIIREQDFDAQVEVFKPEARS